VDTLPNPATAGMLTPVDPRQVRPGDDGVLRCAQCGTRYDLEVTAAAGAVRGAAAELVAAVTATPASARDQRPDPGTWSVNAYAAHVGDALRVLAGRITRLVEEDRPDLPAWDHERDVERLRQDTVPVQRSVMVVTEQAAVVVAVLERVAADPDAERLWRRTGTHPQLGEVGLWQVAGDAVHELRHHAADVVAVAHRVDDLRD